MQEFKQFLKVNNLQIGGEEDYFRGEVYKMKKEFFEKKQFVKKSDIKPKKIDKKEIESTHGQIWGIWHREYFIDKTLVWSAFNKNHVPTKYYPEEYPLPSDSNFRPDLIYWLDNNETQA